MMSGMTTLTDAVVEETRTDVDASPNEIYQHLMEESVLLNEARFRAVVELTFAQWLSQCAS